MKKIYLSLFLFFVFTICKTVAQVNYTFRTFQSTFTSITTGNVPSLNNPTPIGYYEEDEGFANQVPIGFSFNFNNTNYTKLNINVNGFVTFGKGFTYDVNDRYSTNSLENGPLQDSVKPLIAPLWDDLKLKTTSSLKYLTTGTAPNRKFTVEWNNVSWDFNAVQTSVAFQMVLFEGSNKIQFIYSPLYGNITNASASIGIATSSVNKGSFLSVSDLAANASVSSVKENKQIKTRPVAGLAFEFAPSLCTLPATVTIDAYNTKKVSFSWGNTSSSNFDYAVTTSELQPVSSLISTTLKTATVENLKAATQYYINVRTSCSANSKSGWVTIPVKTASEAALPYTEEFENISAPKLPGNTETINLNGGSAWQTITLSNLPPYNKALGFKGDVTQTANAWFLLPGMQLEAGASYRLKFKFKTEDSAYGNQKIEVRLGTVINTGMVGWQTIYKNLKINQVDFKDTSFLFATPTDETYFIAFRCISDKIVSQLLIDDIEVSKIKTSPAKIASLTGVKNDNSNLITWKTVAELRSKAFELQKSIDGVNFSDRTLINTKAVNGVSNVTIDYSATDISTNMVDYYRLKIIDVDDNEFYSSTIKLSGTLPQKITYNTIFPNPAVNIITSIIYSPYNAKGIFKITDSYGKTVQEIPVNIVTGNNVIKADVSRLGNGVYFSKIQCAIGGETESKTFIKQ